MDDYAAEMNGRGWRMEERANYFFLFVFCSLVRDYVHEMTFLFHTLLYSQDHLLWERID